MGTKQRRGRQADHLRTVAFQEPDPQELPEEGIPGGTLDLAKADEEDDPESSGGPPRVFSVVDVFDFLGQTVIGLVIVALGYGSYLMTVSLDLERPMGWALFFLILGFVLTRFEVVGSRAWNALSMFLLIPFFFALLFFAPLGIPLFGLLVVAGEPAYRDLRAFGGVLLVPLLFIFSHLYKIPAQTVGAFLLGSMGLVAGLLAAVPEIRRSDGGREDAQRGQNKEQKILTLTEFFPVPDKRDIPLPFRTPFQTFFLVLAGVCGSVAFASLILWLVQVPVIPIWVTQDALAALCVVLIVLHFSGAVCHVSPRRKVISRFAMNPFYVDSHEITAPEIFAVVLGRGAKRAGLLRNRRRTVFTLQIILHSGVSLAIPLPDFREFPLADVKTHLTAYGQKLAGMLDVTFFSMAEPGSWKTWSGQKFEWKFRNIQPAAINALWETFCVSRFLEPLIADNTERVKVDLTTPWEWAIFGVVCTLFAYATVVLLRKEWGLLLANPRVFYLLLLDGSSVVVTLLAVWRWLIEEYYIFDLGTKEVKFFSRLFIVQSETLILGFGEIGHILAETVPLAGGWGPTQYRLWVVPKPGNGAAFLISDPISDHEEAVTRGKALAHFAGVPLYSSTPTGAQPPRDVEPLPE